jgi:hypothetical protein
VCLGNEGGAQGKGGLKKIKKGAAQGKGEYIYTSIEIDSYTSNTLATR